MRDRVRVGVVGTSWWADTLPLPSLKSHPHAEIAAICGRARSNAERLAQKYEIPRIVTDYRELIGLGGLDALVILTPDDLHHAIVLDALDAGLHVLCEKPLASNVAHARAMYARAQAAGVKHMTMFTYRWLPQYQYLRELVEQGYLGRCYQASFTFRMHYARSAGYSWRFDRRRANGVLGDLGSHMIDLARWHLGEIARVSAHLSEFVEQRGSDGQPIEAANDSAMLLLEFVSGAQASIQVSALAQPIGGPWQQHVALYGEAGSLEASVLQPNEVYAAKVGGSEPQLPLPVPERLWGDVDRADPIDLFRKQSAGPRQFIDMIIEDRPASPDFYDGLKAQEVVDAALEAQRTGQWVGVGKTPATTSE